MDVTDSACRLPDIDALLELINDGSYDDHIEAILAAGHARKRARRGVRRPYGITGPSAPPAASDQIGPGGTAVRRTA